MPENLSLGFPEFSPEHALARPAGLEAALARFQALHLDPNSPVRAIHHQPARPGDYAPVPGEVDPRVREALRAQGIERLYSHQARAFQLVWAGHNLVVVTPTASGKTLCYNLPVLNALLEDPEIRAMYLFPTKALAEDQLDELQGLVDALGAPVRAFTYDGDTPQDARKAIRERANVVLTNPDMLHTGILPHHTRWAKAFEKLRYFVIDELHYYRGVYGSHFANIIRRLKRVCAFYGSKPQFIACSATIANPRELAQALTEEPFELLAENGAPSGEKYFVFYNPPVVNRQLGIRRGYLQEAKRMALEFLERGQQTLVFANSRLATEVLVTYLKDAWSRAPDAVRGYRAGYLPRERRAIERKLREGEIRCVVATNALELGIDVGSLDAAVLAGYPGTIASTWQRAGRAGRRQSTSAAVLVASSAPLDQYIVEHPEYFFGQSPEHARINPDNLEILLNHLKCAAFELPIRDGEKFGPHPAAELCKFLSELGLLHHSAGAWHWTSDTYPADAISLRSITSDNFVVIDTTGQPVAIAHVDFPSALTMLHEKAIYLHEARQYQVERFDYAGRKAYVRRVECDYFTDAIDYTQVKVLQEFASAAVAAARAAHGEVRVNEAAPAPLAAARAAHGEVRVNEAAPAPLAAARAAHGEVRVNRQIVGFKKIKFYTMENVGAGNLSMPEQEMHTTAFWLHFPAAFLEGFADLTVTEKQNGLSGLGNVLRSVAAFLLMSDPRDLGLALGEDISGGLKVYEPDLYLYDNYPGGVGLSAPLFEMTAKLLQCARDLLSACRCEEGCPSCVGPVGEIGSRGKEAAARLLDALLA
jgi:DEAD/DEAH box helicase domain-containing protein